MATCLPAIMQLSYIYPVDIICHPVGYPHIHNSGTLCASFINNTHPIRLDTHTYIVQGPYAHVASITHTNPKLCTTQVFTQASLVALLWGTLCGGLALISDVGYILTAKAYGETGPPPFVSGRTCMVAVTLLVLFPLCNTRHMRQVRARLQAHC